MKKWIKKHPNLTFLIVLVGVAIAVGVFLSRKKTTATMTMPTIAKPQQPYILPGTVPEQVYGYASPAPYLPGTPSGA